MTLEPTAGVAGGGEELRTAPGAVRRFVAAELRRQSTIATVGVVASLVGSAAVAVGPSMVQRAIDDGLGRGDRAALGMSVLGYVVALCVGGLAGGVRSTAMAIGGERLIHRLRTDALSGILRLDLGRFERLRRGDLLARVTSDTEALSGAARWVLPDAVRHVADLAAAWVAVALLDPVLALLTLVAVPPMAVAGRVLRRRSRIVYPRYRAEIGALLGQVNETVAGADTVLAHGRGPERLDRLRAANAAVTTRYLDGTAMRNRFYASITLTRVGATSLVLIAASLLAMDGRISIGTAAAGVLAVSTVFGPLAWLTELLDDVLSAKAALDRVVAATDLPASAGGGVALPERGDLTFRSVTFAYVRDRPVLSDVDLVVPAGTRAVIVGETGAGKTTLARLAAGLSRPTSGAVCFGGVDLAEATAADRRRRLLFVLQEPFCVDGTLAENLRLVAPSAATDVLLDAVARLGLTSWLHGHPAGLERPVGANGALLSAGERQLVGVLRVVLADPAVVILDEATAILDPEVEGLVGEALDRALGDRTVLVIAHRPQTAARSTLRLEVADGSVRPAPALLVSPAPPQRQGDR